MLLLREMKLRELRAAQSADRAAITDADAASESLNRAASSLEMLPLTASVPALRGALQDVQSARCSTNATIITLQKAVNTRAQEISALEKGATQQ
jgi:hypothetical protein